MTHPDQLLHQLREQRLVAIVRGRDAEASVATCLTLVEAGVRLLEVSLTTTDALGVIERVAGEVGAEVQLGAGTVLAEDDVARVCDAGATYVVTPALAPSVPVAVAAGLPVLAGALTPTEVVAAVGHGVTAVKIFPASVFGPGYVAALRDPLPDVALVPVGGVGAAEAVAYLRHGATAVGVGSPLCGDAPHGGDLAALRARAREFQEALR